VVEGREQEVLVADKGGRGYGKEVEEQVVKEGSEVKEVEVEVEAAKWCWRRERRRRGEPKVDNHFREGTNCFSQSTILSNINIYILM